MGRRMTNDLEAFGVALSDDREARVAVDAVGSVDDLAVDLAGERGFGETGPDGRRDLGDGNRTLERFDGAVGKTNGGHGCFSGQKNKKVRTSRTFSFNAWSVD